MRAAKAFSDNDEMAERIYNYASKLWFMYSLFSLMVELKEVYLSLVSLVMLVIVEKD